MSIEKLLRVAKRCLKRMKADLNDNRGYMRYGNQKREIND